jgi:hypothetical protein
MKSRQFVSLKNHPHLTTLKKLGQWPPNKNLVRLVDAKTVDAGVVTYGNMTKNW